MSRTWVRAVTAAALALFTIDCSSQAGKPSGGARPAGTRAEEKHEDAEVVYSTATGLTNGWHNYGWAAKKFEAGGPASVDHGGYGGWIIGKPDISQEYGGLRLKYHAPANLADFLEVRVDSTGQTIFPRVNVGPKHRRDLEGGWTEVWISMADLNPKRVPFDRFVLRAHTKFAANTRILYDEIAFTAPESSGDKGGNGLRAAVDVKVTVDCLLPSHQISPLIYGIAFDFQHDHRDKHQWKLGTTARRWGGNPASRYNWMLGNAWNTAQDWFYRNVNYTPNERYTYDLFLDDNIAHGVSTALTLPTIGWVAKDTESVGFPVAVFGKQQSQEGPKIGNGVGQDGKPITPGPPTMTSIAATPAFIEKWVRAIRAKDASRGRSVQMYILDNEPALWCHTHRDVHPEPVTYDELRDRLIDYGTAVRKADPEAVIAGPAEWGWTGYLYSAKDQVAGFQFKPDRRAHGDVPLMPWLLKQLRAHREKTGVRILDVLDLHYYPQHDGAGHGKTGRVDPYSAAARIRSTRSLWDSSFVDESWINDTIRLIPRMKQWIAENDPGLGISIGEWNFGAEEHMSGGLAVAEALGRFAQGGVTSAFYWTYPPDKSPAFWGFRAYRNFDGSGGRFLDRHVAATSAYALSSAFASRNDAGTKMVVVLLNHDPSGPLNAKVDFSSCGQVVSTRAYSYSGDANGFAAVPADPKGGVDTIEQRLETYSMTVLDVQFQPKRRGEAPPSK